MRPASRIASAPRGFTLIEILISILILALGMLGLGVLFPVIIREQRIGSDAVTGVAIANNASDMLTGARWGAALPNRSGSNAHPARALGSSYATQWAWAALRNSELSSIKSTATLRTNDGLGRGYVYNSAQRREFQFHAQGEWYTALINNDPGVAGVPIGTTAIGLPDTYLRPDGTRMPKVDYAMSNGTNVVNAKVSGHIDLPLAQRFYPLGENVQPQFVWDFAVQRKPDMRIDNAPEADDLRAVLFVRRFDPRLRPPFDPSSGVAKTLMKSFEDGDRVPVGEDASGNPTLDGTNGDTAVPGIRYSTIKTCEVEFFYQPSNAAMNHPDRLYFPNSRVDPRTTLPTLRILQSQMRQPGQKLVDNLGNVYTVVGSGNEAGVNAADIDGVAGADYIRVEPPVPVAPDQASPAVAETGATYPAAPATHVRRAIWQVCFTPQIPVAVRVIDLPLKGTGQ